jgi:enediyne biosynthesis protein E4
MAKPSKFKALVGLIAAAGLLGLGIYALRRPAGSGLAKSSDAIRPPILRSSIPGDTALGSSPGFRDVAAASGIRFRMAFLPNEQGEKFKINLYDHDGDGDDDIYLLNQLGPNALYKNKGDGTFVEVAQQAGVALGDRISVAATFCDYDNDGDQDLFVTSTRGGNVLFRNQGGGTFTDATKQAGLTCVAHSQTAAFFDYDNDAYPDLVVTNSAQWTLNSFDEDSRYFPGLADFWELAKSPKEYNILYHNNRDGTFSDVTEHAGVKGLGWGGDVAVFDFDEDGYLDLFVTNMFGNSQLYHNNRDGTFSDVTTQTLGRTSWGSIGSKVFDYNNDGKLDLLIVDMHSDMWADPNADASFIENIRRTEKQKYAYMTGPSSQIDKRALELEKKFADLFQIQYDAVLFGNTLFKNLGDQKFQEVSQKAGLETFWPWGIATGDFDNDGYEDVYLPSGMGFPYFYWPSYLMMNNGDETFTDRAGETGVEPPANGLFLEQKIGNRPAPRSSRCAATADFDGDGDLEIITNNFNDHPYYFQNNFPRKNYVAFRLKGTRCNWDAIGAVAKVYIGDEVMTRQVHAAGGYLSQSSKTLHYGLGERAKIDRIEIRWPSGLHQTIDNPDINKLHVITEPEG